ncbi:unnamed protein product [Phytophthora lilii]|uniref:Unnamed protein product n=1 Tax=Phytophthora lilii TaxID=2077276 RepID=A0A9W6TVB9_9STRA|nr:unnamed protein product [Phytophthora lilii]
MNVSVEGNPGIGKSYFYVYCAFRFIRGFVDQELKKQDYNLILDQIYFQYHPSDDSLHQLSNDEVRVMKDKPKVVRLINKTSTTLCGWAGMSFLFTSPRLKELDKFKTCFLEISEMWWGAKVCFKTEQNWWMKNLIDRSDRSASVTWYRSRQKDIVLETLTGFLQWSPDGKPSRYFMTWHLFLKTSPKESLKSPPQTLQALVKFAFDNEKNGVGKSLRGQKVPESAVRIRRVSGKTQDSDQLSGRREDILGGASAAQNLLLAKRNNKGAKRKQKARQPSRALMTTQAELLAASTFSRQAPLEGEEDEEYGKGLYITKSEYGLVRRSKHVEAQSKQEKSKRQRVDPEINIYLSKTN